MPFPFPHHSSEGHEEICNTMYQPHQPLNLMLLWPFYSHWDNCAPLLDGIKKISSVSGFGMWPRTFFILLIGAAQRVLRGLLGGLAVLLPHRASARVGAGHGGQAQAVSRRGGAHGADRCLPLVSCARRGEPNPSHPWHWKSTASQAFLSFWNDIPRSAWTRGAGAAPCSLQLPSKRMEPAGAGLSPATSIRKKGNALKLHQGRNFFMERVAKC